MTALISFAGLLLVLFWELIRPRCSRRAAGHRLANVALCLLNGALLFALLPAPAGAAAPGALDMKAVLAVASGFVFLDFVRYAAHRAEHAVPFLWRLHALHHSDEDLDVTTALRHHPFEVLLASAFYGLVVVVFQIPLAAVALHGAAVLVTSALQHGNLRLAGWVERWLRPVLVTTDMHRVHHCRSESHANANFGAVFSVWDRLFGSLAPLPDVGHDGLAFGVEALGPDETRSLRAMLLMPWRLGREAAAR